MNSDWVRSPTARRILVHWADPRPAWLWSGDGARLIWRNASAPYFGAKVKKAGLRLAPAPVPIKGQVPRLIRLGSLGRSSLSRMQFLAGERPVSTTCAVTPVLLPDGDTGILIVGVDPIDPSILAENDAVDAGLSALFPPHAEWLVVSREGEISGGSAGAEELSEAIGLERLGAISADAPSEINLEGETVTASRFKASPADHHLLLLERPDAPPTSIVDVRAEDGLTVLEPTEAETVAEAHPEPLLPMDLPVEEAAELSDPAEQPLATATPGDQSLSSLFDRLAGHESLYGKLTAADETFVPPAPVAAEPQANGADHAPQVAAPEELSEPPVEAVSTPTEPVETETHEPPLHPGEPDVIAAVIAFADDPEDEPDAEPQATYRVTGRGFAALNTNDPVEREPEPVEPTATTVADEPAAEPETPPADAEIVERVSRYNFDELTRILTDRVGGGGNSANDTTKVEVDPPIEPSRPAAVAEGALINVAAETFILNRLPLGIMVFRDQQVLFANRALTDLVAYDSIEALRAAGISAIFPGDDNAEAGPVTQLVRRDGSRFPVTARLQSITWQGRPALMLSASPAVERASHEFAVRNFAETLAQTREEGFVLADRAGLVTLLSPSARAALALDGDATGKPLAALIHGDDVAALREFLERPARFAETARPSISLRSAAENAELVVFAEGQAGIVTGYFGFVTRAEPTIAQVAPTPDDEGADPSMLARISRGVRRPLNTIIGFADLIRSAAFGTIENHRYLEYARDIKTAGQEIAVLVDELDDFARLSAGRYATRPAELDLTALLDSCVVRVRGQASAARVLVRSAISERLPHIRADRASFGQAVLNLLASAIDQTPAGGSVIVSAQASDDGGIAVNVRDGGQAPSDLGDRFVVFRDGVGKDGEPLAPVRSSVGLALTRALITVNSCSLSVDPAGMTGGTLFSLIIPADLVDAAKSA